MGSSAFEDGRTAFGSEAEEEAVVEDEFEDGFGIGAEFDIVVGVDVVAAAAAVLAVVEVVGIEVEFEVGAGSEVGADDRAEVDRVEDRVDAGIEDDGGVDADCEVERLPAGGLTALGCFLGGGARIARTRKRFDWHGHRARRG